MANIPGDLRYTEEHEYVRKTADGNVEVGITDYAQGELGEVVYVELPSVGTKLGSHDVLGPSAAVVGWGCCRRRCRTRAGGW